MTNSRATSFVALLLTLLVQCGTPSEQPKHSGPASGGARASAGFGQGGASVAGASHAFGGVGGSGLSTAARGGGVGLGGVSSMLFGGVSGSLGSAGAGMSGVPNTLSLASTAVPTNGVFAAANTCAGADLSPDLEWAPGVSQARSYAVALADAASGALQWVVWDIPASVTSLPAGLATTPLLTTPAGAKQVSASGNGYVGPCPQGQQRFYEFEIYALPVATLAGVTTDSPPSAVATAINLTPPVDVAVFGASAGMSNGGAAGTAATAGAGGTTSM